MFSPVSFRRRALRATLLFFAVWLHAAKPLLFSVNPLPLCLLAAAPDGGTVALLFLGLLPAIRTAEGLRTVAAGGVLIVLRIGLLFRRRRKSGVSVQILSDWEEGSARRSFAAPAVMLPLVIWRCIVLGFSYYALWGGLFLLLSALPLTFLLLGLFPSDGAHTAGQKAWQGGAAAVLLCASALLGREITLWRVPLVPAVWLLLLLLVGERGGLWQSLAVGAVGAVGYAPTLLPAGLASSLTIVLFWYGVRRFFPRTDAALARLPAAALGAGSMGGVILLLRGSLGALAFIPSLFAGALGYLSLTRLAPHFAPQFAPHFAPHFAPPEDSAAPKGSTVPEDADTDYNKEEALRLRLAGLAGAFSGLAALCRNAVGDRKPSSLSEWYGDAATVLREALDCTAPEAPGEDARQEQRPLLTVTVEVTSQPATAESDSARRTPSGDRVSDFSGMEGRYFVLLCDGMGSGRDAARVAGVSATFAEKLLRAGVSPGAALSLLNHFLCARSRTPTEELTCAVDLLEFSTADGKARFFKCGAAPSAVLRGDALWLITAHTLPLGILGTPDVQCFPFDLLPGDRVWLISDGVTEGAPDETAFLRQLLPLPSCRENPASLLTAAAGNGSRDDKTVALLTIREASAPQ